VETCVLLSKLKADYYIEAKINIEELELTAIKGEATYAEIKEYILNKFGLKVLLYKLHR
jgi:23S rRNA (uracil1939-C5)-methyltransferase